MDDDKKFIEQVFKKLNSVGCLTDGSMNRLGYSYEESYAHEILQEIGNALGYKCRIDQVGNTFINPYENNDYYLIGSHLDTVPNGGKYDGVAGIVAGILVLKWCRDNGKHIPVTVGAFRCEESSRFNRATVGSGLINKGIDESDLTQYKDKNGISVSEAMVSCGFKPVVCPIRGIKEYLELHIEQGRILEKNQYKLGLVTAIASPARFQLKIFGKQQHSGATPIFSRKDSLSAASEIVLLVEYFAEKYAQTCVTATVGYISNEPNIINIVPGFTELLIDIRGIDKEVIDNVIKELQIGVKYILKEKRNLKYSLKEIYREDPALMDLEVIEGLKEATRVENIPYWLLPSGAGHDAVQFSKNVKTGMLFIPSKNGISHSKHEFSDMEDLLKAAKVIYTYLIRKAEINA